MNNYTKTLLETVRQLQEENQAIITEDDGYLELTEEEMEILDNMGVLDILLAHDMVERSNATGVADSKYKRQINQATTGRKFGGRPNPDSAPFGHRKGGGRKTYGGEFDTSSDKPQSSSKRKGHIALRGVKTKGVGR